MPSQKVNMKAAFGTLTPSAFASSNTLKRASKLSSQVAVPLVQSKKITSTPASASRSACLRST